LDLEDDDGEKCSVLRIGSWGIGFDPLEMWIVVEESQILAFTTVNNFYAISNNHTEPALKDRFLETLQFDKTLHFNR
jgi:hypothetical protein